MQTVQRTKKRYSLFTNKALFMLILPIVIESAFTMSLGLVDSFMVKSVGENGTAMSAVSNVDQISNVMIQLFAAFGTGGAIITSQCLGAKNIEDANKSAKQLYVLMLCASLVVAAVCLIFNKQIIDLIFNGDATGYKDYAYTYFYMMAASYPLLAMFYASAAILRAERKSMNTMTSAGISFCLNVGFNALFIYGLNLGVLGAGLATLISRAFPAIFLTALLTNKNNTVKIKIFEKFRFDAGIIKRIALLAIPSGIESCLFQVGKVMTASFVADASYDVIYGAAKVNNANVANSVTQNINTIGSIVGNGINTSILTVVGQAVGTGDVDCVKYYIKKMFIISFIGNAACVAVTWACSSLLVGVFADTITTEAVNMAHQCITLCFAVQLFTYPLSFGGPAVLKATSDVRYTMVSAITSMAVMRVGLCFIMCTPLIPSLHLGALGLWIGMVADWGLRSILFTSRIISGRWRKASGMLNNYAEKAASEESEIAQDNNLVKAEAGAGEVTLSSAECPAEELHAEENPSDKQDTEE